MATTVMRWVGFRHRHSYTPLDSEPPARRRRAPWRGAAMSISVCATVGWAAVNVLSRSGTFIGNVSMTFMSRAGRGQGEAPAMAASSMPMQTPKTTDHAMSVKVWNEYMDVETSMRLMMYPWEHVAEPYKRTKMEVSSWNEEVLGDSVHFR